MIYRFMYDNVIGIAYYAKLSMRKSTKKTSYTNIGPLH